MNQLVPTLSILILTALVATPLAAVSVKVGKAHLVVLQHQLAF